MPSKYKLTYFNLRARAEVTRMIFAYAGVDYEDVRIDRADWPQIKPTTITGQVPFIEIDGTVYSQSNAISRYLARQYGLNGKTPEDGLRIDMIVDTIEDMIKSVIVLFGMEDEAKKAETKKKLSEETLPGFLANLEKILVANKGGDGFFVGDQVSWADFMFLNWGKWPEEAEFFQVKVDLSKTPKLQALRERVQSIPQIAAWIAKRPQSMA